MEFFWRHFAPCIAGPRRRADFASADIPAVDIAEAQVLLRRGSARIDPAGVRRMLRLRLMHRRENDQSTQQGSDPGDINSITSPTCSRRKFLASHCLAASGSRDEFIAVAPTPHAPSRGRGEMHHAHNRGRVAEAVEHLSPRLSGLPGVVIRPHAKLRIFSLDRRVYHIAGDERVPSGLADQHGVMVDRVAGRRNELDRTR